MTPVKFYRIEKIVAVETLQGVGEVETVLAERRDECNKNNIAAVIARVARV